MSDEIKTPKFSLGDYITVSYQDRKSFVQVTKKTKHICEGVLQKNLPYSSDVISFERADVIANYADSPEKMGMEVLRHESVIKAVGSINYFVRPTKTLIKEIEKTVSKGYDELEKRALVSFFPINVEVRGEKGKLAGSYTTNMKTDLDTLCFHLLDGQSLRHTFFHEIGHGIFNRLVTKHSTKADWVEAYNELIAVDEITKHDLKRLYKNFVASGMEMREFRKELEEESDTVILKEILAYIKKYHRLSVQDLDILILDSKFDEIRKVWARDPLALTNANTTKISEYAAKSPTELFCEAFAFYMTGKKLPKEIKKLLEKTLQEAAS